MRYSWPYWLLVALMPVIGLAMFHVIPHWIGYVALGTPFALCPLRDRLARR